MNWIELLDTLKERYRLESDSELARLVGATPNDIWHTRARGKKLPAYARWQILDRLGFVKTRTAFFAALEVVLAPSIVAEIVESHNKIIRQNTISLLEKDKLNGLAVLNEAAKSLHDQGVSEDEFVAAAIRAYQALS